MVFAAEPFFKTDKNLIKKKYVAFRKSDFFHKKVLKHD